MAYQINFDGLKRDICLLACVSTSQGSTSAIIVHENLLEEMRDFKSPEVASLILSISSRLRILRDMNKDLNGEFHNVTCGYFFERMQCGEAYFENDTSLATFFQVLDKILHATEYAKDFASSNGEDYQFLYDLAGHHRDKKDGEWRLRINILEFCDVAIKFANKKK